MDDEADIYEGVRAQFPLSFGKQTKSQTPLELVHNATRRNTAANDGKPSASEKTTSLPSLSSSSQEWINSVRNSNPRNSSRDGDGLVGPPRPPAGPEEEDEKMIGPPPGSGGAGDGDEDEEAPIGPPRPPSGKGDDDNGGDGTSIGPPRPPPGALETDSDEDSDEDADDDPGYRIPLSNEIVLKGHTKVKHITDMFPRISRLGFAITLLLFYGCTRKLPRYFLIASQ